jgi:hypothetical protein
VPNPHLFFTLLTVGKPIIAVADEDEGEED